MDNEQGHAAHDHYTVNVFLHDLIFPFFISFKALKVLGKELSVAAKEGTIHRILVFSETKKGCDEV